MKAPAPLFFASLALIAACASQPATNTAAATGDDDPVIDALFAHWDRPGSPGCAVAVSRNGDRVYAQGYGYANLDYDIPMTPQSVVDVASVTKQFVAAMLNMLAYEGKLSLDDDIREWLPELPEYEARITLRHMLYHTSGLRDYLTLFPLAGRDHYHPISHAQILAMMARQRALNFAPGERYEYSNTAYMLLAQVIERVSGQSLADFAEERIFTPVGMDSSLMYDNHEAIIPKRATGYDRHSDSDIRMVHNFNFDVPGDGQLYSTVEDLLRWDQYLHGPVKPPYYASMLTEGTLNSGEPLGRAQGLFLGHYRGLETVHHTGSSWGSKAILVRFIEPGLAIAIACNDGLAERWPLVRGIADYLLADQLGPVEQPEHDDEAEPGEPPDPQPVELRAAQLAEYTGSYFSPELDATYRFSVADGILVVHIEQEPGVPVIASGDDRFAVRFDERAYAGVLSASLAFDRDSAGRVSGFRLSSGNERNILFRRADTIDLEENDAD